ncbi:MAG: endonuclease/exonuclease/phosphatase family protein [Bacteroidota bacterium]
MRTILSHLWTAVTGIFAAGFLFGYLARYGYPAQFWWIELLAVVLPFFVVGLGLLFVSNLFLRRRGLAALCGVLLLIGVARVVPWSRLTHQAAPSDSDLTLMSFNVPRWWGYLMETKTQEMASFMERVEPDVAALQEATLAYVEDDPRTLAPPYVRILIDSLGYRPAGTDFVDGKFNTSQPVIGRVDFLGKDQKTLVHSDDRGVGGTHVVRARFRWDGREAVLYNLHLRTYGRDKPWHEQEPEPYSPSFWFRYLAQYRDAYRIRNWEVDQLLELVEAEEVPVIIAGDLNSTSNNWVYRRLAEGRQDAFRVAGRGWGATYHTRLPVVRIDFVLVGPEWEVVDAYVPHVWLSDHLPVVTRIRWSENGSLSVDGR